MLFRNDKKDNRDAASNLVPLLPLRELIVFPHEVYPIFVGRQKSIKALEAAEKRRKLGDFGGGSRRLGGGNRDTRLTPRELAAQVR